MLYTWRVPGSVGEGIRDEVLGSSLPAGGEVVAGEGRLQLEQAVIGDLVQAAIVEEGYQRVRVGDHLEVLQAVQEEGALLGSPGDCQGFELGHA
jgi:hypothetical protein